VIGEPPLEAGGENVTETLLLPLNVAVPMVGAPGTPGVVMLFDAPEYALCPNALIALTAKVTVEPAYSPVTEQGDEVQIPVKPYGVDTTL
jgi:hypothetical protein